MSKNDVYGVLAVVFGIVGLVAVIGYFATKNPAPDKSPYITELNGTQVVCTWERPDNADYYEKWICRNNSDLPKER